MEKYFALIKNKIVEAVVVATDDFISHAQTKYDFIIDVTDIERPTSGDSYYPDTKNFVSNFTENHIIPVDTAAEYLARGTEDSFEPFETSKYTVTYNNGTVQIGCKYYSAMGLLDTLHKLLVEKQKTTTYFTSLKTGPTHGKFDITWQDAEKIYQALSRIKFI